MKILTGKIISKKMDKTATVVVDRFVAHPVYGKRMRKTKKYHVHDETNSKIGDVIKFVPSKPYSKLKKWKIIQTKKTK